MVFVQHLYYIITPVAAQPVLRVKLLCVRSCRGSPVFCALSPLTRPAPASDRARSIPPLAKSRALATVCISASPVFLSESNHAIGFGV